MTILSPFWANRLGIVQAMPAKSNVSCVQSTHAPETEYNGDFTRILPRVRTPPPVEYPADMTPDEGYCRVLFSGWVPKQADPDNSVKCQNSWACKRLSTTHETIPTHMFSYVLPRYVDAKGMCDCQAITFYPLHLRRANSTEAWTFQTASDSFIITGYTCRHKKACRKFNC